MNMIRYAPWIGWRALFRVSRHANAQNSSSSAFTINTSPSTASEPQEKNNIEETLTPVSTVTKISKSQQKSELDIEQYLRSSSKRFSKNQHKEQPRSKPVVKLNKYANIGSVVKKKTVSDIGLGLDLAIIHDQLTSAKTVESLLNFASKVKLTRVHCLTIVSTLAEWTNKKLVELSSFESDPRFLEICKQLGHGVHGDIPKADDHFEGEYTRSADLAMVLEVTGDDDASNLVSGISLRKSIKVMSTLAVHRRRSLPLLQSLASNLSQCTEVFNIKEGADVLYAMSVLNFADATLLERTCRNVCLGLKANTNSAVVRSIVMSLGHLRYKHLEILNELSEWYVNKFSTCRPQDVSALLMTLAVLVHTPANQQQLFHVVTKELSSTYMTTSSAWLDVVWALVVLNQATAAQVESVLEPQFQDKLLISTGETQKLSVSTKRKLLNINSAAKLLIPNYKGPLLQSESWSSEILMKRSVDKQLFVNELFASLSNLLPSEAYLQKNVDMGMGFFLDGECIIDNKLNPLPLSDPTSLQKGKRIAIFAWNYDDMCRAEQPTPTGHADLAMRLAKASGYHVLSVPFTEFNPQGSLIQRVKYLEQQLKMIATLQ